MTQRYPTAVIITAKNAAATIAQAVRSALAQGCAAEVVVVSDGSTDRTVEAARACDDGSGRLKLIRFELNQGPSAGRNAAIAASSAPYLCVLDADDYMDPQRLDRLFAEAPDHWDLLADDLIFATGYSPDTAFDHLLPAGARLPQTIDLDVLGHGNLPRPGRQRRELGFLKPVMSRAFLERHGLGYDERLRLAEDFVLYARCLYHGARFELVEACGYYAVQHPDSLSAVHRTADIAALHQALVELDAEARGQRRSLGAVKAVLRHARNNLAFRRALDAKRERGLAGLVDALGAHLGSTPFIVREVARAKLGRLIGQRA